MNLGEIKVVNTKYRIYLYRDFKELQEKAIARDERYLLTERKEEHKPVDGYCDYSAKEINLFIDAYTAKDYFEATIRHEICHAFLYEIGYQHHDDEDFIDKLSRWIPLLSGITDDCIDLIKSHETRDIK